MGGVGSGRPGRLVKADDCLSLDVNRLHRAGYLAPGYWCDWQWRRSSEPLAVVNVQSLSDGLRLSYRVLMAGKDWEIISYVVPISWSPCTKGGSRPYFHCPGVPEHQSCGRRVTKLYAGRHRFLCRHCLGLTYESRSEAPHDRLQRRANKLRRALGGRPGAASPIPPRRKGQWRQAYEAQVAQVMVLEAEAEAAFALHLNGGLPAAATWECLNSSGLTLSDD